MTDENDDNGPNRQDSIGAYLTNQVLAAMLNIRTDSRRQRKPRWLSQVTLAILGCCWASVAYPQKSTNAATQAAPQTAFKPPANADPAVQYVGTENCIGCHQAHHESYLETTHSRSVALPGQRNEAASASFQHQLSGHQYEVEIRDGTQIHREIMNDADGQRLAETEFPIAYTIGSGAHGLSYIYQTEGRFLQSPLSWYQGPKEWGMSPGYDTHFTPGFRRTVSNSCFFCHVGSIDQTSPNPQDFSVREMAIGCERCHGPGELHVARYRENPDFEGADDTIVNPAKLSRSLSEAVCQQCHLQAAGKAIAAGKDEWDFRPGLPLTDFRIDYQHQLGDDKMRIVGHVEQLHMSECYTQTESLTCTTCHNPHETVSAENLVAHYRSVCLNCHQDEECNEPIADRVRMHGNDCTVCHMPKLDTEVAHAAFSHHRIGVHDEDKSGTDVITGLTSVLDVSSLTDVQRARGKAIAKFQVSQADPDNPAFQEYGFDAARTLIQIHNLGKSDPDATAILALLANGQGQSPIASDLAKEILSKENGPSRARIEALRIQGQITLDNQDTKPAFDAFRELVKHQRSAYDWYCLGVLESRAGNLPVAVRCFEKCIEIDITQVEAHGALSSLRQSLGDMKAAKKHADMATRVQTLMQGLVEKSRLQNR